MCDTAAGWVAQAGAVENLRARARLRAASRHELHIDVPGGWLPDDVVQLAAAELGEDLRTLDDDAGEEGTAADHGAGGDRRIRHLSAEST